MSYVKAMYYNENMTGIQAMYKSTIIVQLYNQYFNYNIVIVITM